MFNLKLFSGIALSAIILISGCSSGSEDGADVTLPPSVTPPSYTTSFLSIYNDANDTKKGLEIVSGAASGTSYSASRLTDYFPRPYFYFNKIDVSGNVYAMSLDSYFDVNSTSRGIMGYMDSGTVVELPLVEATASDDYKYFVAGTVEVSPSSHVFYLSATNDINYGDQYQDYLIRADATNRTWVVATGCKSFTLSQPEIGVDTEACIYSTDLKPSLDGRYVYGDLEAYGVDAGAIHWDYSILYQYDFVTQEYTRLAEGDGDVGFVGMTSDRKKIVYKNGSDVKVYDLATKSATSIYNIPYPKYDSGSVQWNTKGQCFSGYLGVYYNDFENDQQIQVVDHLDTDYAQFSEDGNSIYFIIEGDENNTLYKTEDLSVNSPYEAIAVVPKIYFGFLRIRNN